jgi:serine/threonine protein kinase
MGVGPPREFGRYRVVSELGRGGMGVVYRASDTVLRREVALKVLQREEVDPVSHGAASLLGEARAAAAIGHPNAVAVYDVGDVDGIRYIAMELVEGRTLRACVGDQSLPADTRVRWLIDVARALSAAHVRGVIHRDVKPENILVREDGVIKVLDFGIARQVPPTSVLGSSRLSTTRGTLVGTPAYMAPEQIRGEPVDAAADQFAWGVVAYELLTGARPWGARDKGLRALAEISWRDPAHVCDLNAAVARSFGDVTMRALSRDRSARFNSMSDLLASLDPQDAPGSPTTARSHARTHDETALSQTVETVCATTETTTPRGGGRPAGAQPPGAPRRPSSPEPPARIGGKYSPVRCLAKGRASTVFEVEHIHTGERLALKLLDLRAALDRTSLQRFKREARVSAQLKSEHVVRIIDADVAAELGDTPFLVMELLEGQTLEQLTAGRGQPPARVLDWMSQAARGLERSHAFGIVHRDLKPRNLFLVRGPDQSAAIKILDFGVSKTTAIGDENTTTVGTIVGTPPYLPPEQAAGDSTRVGLAADVWALGMTTYRLLSGREYWVGDDVATLLSLVLFAPIEPPSMRGVALGEPFDRWFLRSCAREPDRRFASVSEQMNALASALGLGRPAPQTSEAADTGDSLSSVAVGSIPAAPKPGIPSEARRVRFPLRTRMALAAMLVVGAALGNLAWRPAGAPLAVPRPATFATLAAPTTAALSAPAPGAMESPGVTSIPSSETATRPLRPASSAPGAHSGPSETRRRDPPPAARAFPVDPYADPH